MLLILFRNITEQQKLEKQMFESAKMAELGTVGSSIAHELNNPLGGVISFLQLIKMDCPEGDPIRADIIEMEKAGTRCKEIVENLLGFTRLPDSSYESDYNLIDVLAQALRIVELKSKSMGIQIKMESKEKEIWLEGHPGLMAQAFGHILQNSIESIAQKLLLNSRFLGEIKISIQKNDAELVVEIVDNGEGGLIRGTSLAKQIIEEYKGRLEISSQPKMGIRAIVALSNV
jgi:signal transduction histidine kinase